MVLSRIDHLVWAVDDLDGACGRIEEEWGVRPVFGGRHEGRGTHNALLSLGGTTYLEVIAPDPGQEDPDFPRPFGLGLDLPLPVLASFAVTTPDLVRRVGELRTQGYDPGEPLAMSRTRPDGVRLDWTLTFPPEPEISPRGELIAGVPFLIDWGSTPSPALSAPRGCSLVSLAVHRSNSAEALRLERVLALLDCGVEVIPSDRDAVEAVIDTPGGRMSLA
ncbi:MAG TPA: VOC family protein [Acidimicrobiales bacterium]|nr:VOC family protein [Acidimicrobiales bacterium]